MPFPINRPELLFNYVPADAKFYMTLYDEWSAEKKAELEKLGCRVEVMWQRSNDDKFTSGTIVREKIIAGEPWQELVPSFVYQFMTANGIDDRLRRDWSTT